MSLSSLASQAQSLLPARGATMRPAHAHLRPLRQQPHKRLVEGGARGRHLTICFSTHAFSLVRNFVQEESKEDLRRIPEAAAPSLDAVRKRVPAATIAPISTLKGKHKETTERARFWRQAAAEVCAHTPHMPTRLSRSAVVTDTNTFCTPHRLQLGFDHDVRFDVAPEEVVGGPRFEAEVAAASRTATARKPIVEKLVSAVVAASHSTCTHTLLCHSGGTPAPTGHAESQ